MNELSRRKFLVNAGTSASAAWVSANWPAVLAAGYHAREAVQAAHPYKFEFFTPEQATEIEAVASRIIPTDDTPGAREAGVVYFIDRALVTFASEDQKTYQEGLPDLQLRVREMFPELDKFSAGSAEQQDELLLAFDDVAQPSRRRFGQAQQKFFQTVRGHTIAGFLIDPDSGGNRDGVGWKVIGREREHAFQPPFGYYDKGYPGWQPAPKDASK